MEATATHSNFMVFRLVIPVRDVGKLRVAFADDM
jgi:hypothetical protein